MSRIRGFYNSEGVGLRGRRMRRSWASIAMLVVTAPAAILGIIYFVITRRHPTPALLMVFGVSAVLLIVAAIVVLVTASGVVAI
jgi:hypothetical protein